MTDEEKAEERTHKEYCDKCFNNLCKRNMNDKCFYSHTKDYLDGLAEARKESKSCIELLQNEKAELAEDFCKQLEELKAQIEKMKKDCKRNDNKTAKVCH